MSDTQCAAGFISKTNRRSQGCNAFIITRIDIRACTDEFPNHIFMASTDCVTHHLTPHSHWKQDPYNSPAICNADHPLPSLLSTSAPWSIRKVTISTASEDAAQCKGVRPSTSAESTRAGSEVIRLRTTVYCSVRCVKKKLKESKTDESYDFVRRCGLIETWRYNVANGAGPSSIACRVCNNGIT